MRNLFLIFCFLIALVGCSRDEVASNISKDDAYRLFADLRAPAKVPDTVKNIQDRGAAWMDFTVCCRFNAPEGIVKSILATGFKETKWEKIRNFMYPEYYTKGFSPRWNPKGIKTKECYKRIIDHCDAIDVLYLVIDRKNGLCYGVGEGSIPHRETT